MDEANFTRLSWWWILFPGAAVAVLDYVLIYLVVYAYIASWRIMSGGEPDAARLESTLMAFGVLGLPLMHLILVILAARWVANRSDGRFVLYGVLVGLVALVGRELIGLYFGPFRPDLAALFLFITLAGGWVGGLWGRAAVEHQEALYRASREIETSQKPEAVVKAIGEHLAGSDVSGVAVWRTAPPSETGPEGDLVLLAAWTPRKAPGWSAEERLDERKFPFPAPEGTGDGVPILLRGGGLEVFGNRSPGSQDARAVLLLPLRSAGARRFGLMAVAFRHRRRVSRRTARDYQTIGAQAALALENLRLVDEARRAGMVGERQRLANEIHDTLAQGFNSIAINLDTATRKLPSVPGPVRRLLNLSRDTARESLAEARRLVWALRPEALDRHSLPEAVQLLTERWSQESGVAAGIVLTGTPRQLPPEIEAALLRTAQETLSNARKHAHAKRIVLTLSYLQETVRLDARDDGLGFDPEKVADEVRDQSSGGFGLKAMRERIEHLGGTVHVESAPGEGTSLAVELPTDCGRPAPDKEVEPVEEIR